MANINSLSFLLLHGLLGQLGVTGHPRSPMPAEYQAVVQEPNHDARRREMVERQLRERGIRSEAVLSAMGKVPRHRFVPSRLSDLAYGDDPLPIGQGQTISQPYIVALMTELIEPRKTDAGAGDRHGLGLPGGRTGGMRRRGRYDRGCSRAGPSRRESASASLVIARCTRESATATRAGPSALRTTRSCSPPRRRDASRGRLLDQLKVGGRLVAPVGREDQDLVRITRTETGFTRKVIAPVRFVPMTGKAQRGDADRARRRLPGSRLEPRPLGAVQGISAAARSSDR